MSENKVFRLCCGLVVAAWCGFAPAGEPGPSALADLAWMAGHWVATVGDVHMEEIWTEPRGGIMLGIHRDVAVSGSAFFEYLRIEDRDGEVAYVASPFGRGMTDFALVLSEDQRAIFENPAHDFPQRIIYRRDGDRLIARVEGTVDGEPRGEEWEWQLE
jgi:hypothetical protein